METRHLAIADRNVAEAKGRADRQIALIERLKRRGQSTETAEDFLSLLNHTLAGWNREKDVIELSLGAHPGSDGGLA